MNKHTPLKWEMFRVDAKGDMNVRVLSDGPDAEGLLLNINEQYIALKLNRKKSINEGSFVSIEL